MDIDLFNDWAEYLMALLLIVGVVFAVVIKSLATSLVIMFLFGLLFGRLWFKQRKNFRIILSLAIMGLVFGFILGKLFGYTEVIIIVFFGGAFISYYIHKLGWISSVEY